MSSRLPKPSCEFIVRPILIRFLLDRPWAVWASDVQGVPGIGIATVVAVIGGLAIGWLLWKRGLRWTLDDRVNVGIWLGLLIAITLIAPALPVRLANWLPPEPGAAPNQLREPVNSLPLFGYAVMVLLGFASGTAVGQLRARRAGIEPTLIFDLAFWTLVCGVLGGRLFYIVQHEEIVFRDARGVLGHLFAAVNLSSGGLVLIGAMLGGAVGFFAFCQRRRLAALPLLDLLTPSIFIGEGFGRIGCLLYGCCYGDPSSLPWAVTFGPESAAFESLVARGYVLPSAAACMPLHPTQVYMSINAFLLAFVTYAYYRRRRLVGDVFALGVILYAITRFLIEFVRADELGQLNTGLTISQLMSLGLLALGVGLVLWPRRHRAGAAAPARRPVTTEN